MYYKIYDNNAKEWFYPEKFSSKRAALSFLRKKLQEEIKELEGDLKLWQLQQDYSICKYDKNDNYLGEVL